MSYYIDDLSEGATKIIAKIEQPPEGYVVKTIYQDMVVFTNTYNYVDVFLPLPLGAEVVVRSNTTGTTRYFVTDNKLPSVLGIPNDVWLTVTAVEVKQVKDLTMEEVKASGIEGELFKTFADLNMWIEIATLEEK